MERIMGTHVTGRELLNGAEFVEQGTWGCIFSSVHRQSDNANFFSVRPARYQTEYLLSFLVVVYCEVAKVS